DSLAALTAFLKDIVNPVNESSQSIKPDITGAAAFMHGYPALDGLGITRARNHMVEAIPVTKNIIFAVNFIERSFLLMSFNPLSTIFIFLSIM
ncbi:MAG TPA: hypothetical protein VHO72_16370, partial [Bacteroidales bacterium]|nr:hypothetical protein [Bacteroidales bacterium]